MDTPSMTPPLRKCTQCGAEFPATTEYFHRGKKCKYGLSAKCKACARETTRRWYQANPEKARENSRRYRQANPEKVREAQRRWGQANPEKVRESSRRKRQANPEKAREQARRWRQTNPEKRREIERRWRQANPEKVREARRRRYQANPEKHRESSRRYHQTHPEKAREQARRRYQVNPEKVLENVQRRRSRKHSLLHTFTAETWEACLNYFHGCCAYCGAQRDFWSPLHQDHYIPLSAPDCPGTIPTNIVPACRSCNFSKKNIPPMEWLTRKFGKRQAKVIAARIQAYFDSLTI